MAAATLRTHRGRLVVPAPVTAEADYLIGRRAGRGARLAFVEDLGRGALEVACLSAAEDAAAATVDRRYADLDMGLSDAAIVVVAHRHRTRTIATFDHRCFRAVEPLDGGTFTLLPEDAT
ncbi:MAG: PIN domain-containing protein [Actinobacteria bacterium]|nr:PIN domain-containing protein [Actinomycetota bacterium]